MKIKKILITGGVGHIGSYLIRYLPKIFSNLEIYILDNMISNRYISIFDLPKKAKYKFIILDLSNCLIKEIPKVDLVLHFAAKTDAAQSAKYLKEWHDNNYKSTLKIINYVKKNNAKLIFASSTSVYGPQSDVVYENCSKKELNPQSPYANIKLKEEKLIINKLKNFNNKFIILRLGTILGFANGIRFHTAVNKFSLQASMGVPLTVWKTAFNQKRPYLTLQDLGRLIVHIINGKVEYQSIYNIVSKNLTVKEIINYISKYKKVKIKFVSHPIMNQMSYEVSTKKIKNSKFKFLSNISSNIKKTISKLDQINTIK